MKDKDREKERDRDRDRDRDRSRKDRDGHRRDKDRGKRSRYVNAELHILVRWTRITFLQLFIFVNAVFFCCHLCSYTYKQ